ncbi:MAG: tripartite tricarboxylate transporter substrate binding protein [Proteobacteria bacterium]|nr:tripartite tricarboxylate transporter substrate binding protein [Burkholderiales bacterium]
MRIASATVIAAVLIVAALPASAQNYPVKPIRVIIPFPPGNTGDIVARLVGPKLTERHGQPVLVDNRPGAAGQLGLEIAAKAPADGYTLAFGQGGNLVVAPHTYKKIGYDPLKDFTPVALIATNYLAIAVHPSVPFKTAKDLITYARSNPGKLTVGTNGEGGFPHLAFEDFRLQAGFKYLHVPYKGSAQIAGELMGGQIDAAIDGFTGLAPHVKSGRLRLLGFTNPTRVALYPDVPVVAESLPGYDSRGWFGFIAPTGTPRDIVTLLNRSINDAIALPELRDPLQLGGLILARESPEFFGEVIRRDFARYGKLARDIGFQPQ